MNNLYDHAAPDRRKFLATSAALGAMACADMSGVNVLSSPAIASELKKTGMAQATAYRRIEAGVASGELILDAESGTYHASSQDYSQ